MSENETWLNRFLKETPIDHVKLDPYYAEQEIIIRYEIEQLLEFKISDEQFNSALQAWHYRDILVGRCDQYDFALLRNKIDKFIAQIEDNLAEQKYLAKAINFLSPIIGYGNIQDVISVHVDQLVILKQIREELFRSRGRKGDENSLTKRAYFELFFIAELLGLKPPTQNYKPNDLITFAEIMTRQTNTTRSNISAHYQDYEKIKKVTPVIGSLIKEGKQDPSDKKRWCFFLELFQDHIYSHISVPS